LSVLNDGIVEERVTTTTGKDQHSTTKNTANERSTTTTINHRRRRKGVIKDSLFKSNIYAGEHVPVGWYHAAAMNVSETPAISETLGVSETLTLA
jgi:hypothetical protein